MTATSLKGAIRLAGSQGQIVNGAMRYRRLVFDQVRHELVGNLGQQLNGFSGELEPLRHVREYVDPPYGSPYLAIATIFGVRE